jgi:hypothetical protein
MPASHGDNSTLKGAGESFTQKKLKTNPRVEQRREDGAPDNLHSKRRKNRITFGLQTVGHGGVLMDGTFGLADCVDRVARFSGTNLASTIAELEYRSENLGKTQLAEQMAAAQIDSSLLKAAFIVKHAATQIDVVIHAIGMLVLLPSILDQDESIESLSLRAGSSETKRFDLETNRRIAEFTFIEWQGNDNTRLQKVFKDFFRLVEFETAKSKELWLTDDKFVLKYLRSKASVRSATHKHRNVWEAFQLRHPSLKTVSEYYRDHESQVRLRVYDRDLGGRSDSLG